MLTSPNGILREARSSDALAEVLDVSRPQSTQYVRTQDGYVDLPVVPVEAERLVYRADNGRILSEIRHACRDEGLLDAKGRIVEADSRVQAILHRLLVAKASDQTSPIFAELEQYALQTEPLLITRQGLVVNGNRRLASMRELLGRDPEKYAGFKTIACAVLPDSFSYETIEFIEANLQMAPDLKLSYSWINRRLKLREHVADLPRELIVDAYRLKDAGEIENELGELALAESYLDYVGASADFDRVADLEAYFLAFHESLAALKNPHLRELWTFAGFALLATRDSLDQPVEHLYPFTPPRPQAIPNWVMRAFAADRGVAEPQSTGQNDPIPPRIATRVRPILADPANAGEVARHLVALINTLKSNETELLGATRVLANLRNFRAAVEDKGLSLLDERQYRQIRVELVALLSLLGEDPSDLRPAPPRDTRQVAADSARSVGKKLRHLIRRN